jgi:hypothetical protein
VTGQRFPEKAPVPRWYWRVQVSRAALRALAFAWLGPCRSWRVPMAISTRYRRYLNINFPIFKNFRNYENNVLVSVTSKTIEISHATDCGTIPLVVVWRHGDPGIWRKLRLCGPMRSYFFSFMRAHGGPINRTWHAKKPAVIGTRNGGTCVLFFE